MAYGPWIVSGTLYEKDGTYIYATTNVSYVLKFMTHAEQLLDEMRLLLMIYHNRPRHSIELPKELYGLYGQTTEGGWYAMKRYTGCVDRGSTYCKTLWRLVAQHCLQFLQDFHTTYNLVHMDIKRANILVDTHKKEFVVTDYELAESLTSSAYPVLLRDNKDDYKWYFFMYGAELDQPIVAWRFDLAALGYVLASLTAPEEAWTFEADCELKRVGGGSGITEDELVAKRAAALATADPAVLAYFERIKEVAWDAKLPPSRAFYEELEALFTK